MLELISELRPITYRGITFIALCELYRDEDGVEYETEEQYHANHERIVEAYNQVTG